MEGKRQVYEIGYISSLVRSRFFGFISVSPEFIRTIKGGERNGIFFHGTALVDSDFFEARIGDRVEYITVETDRGLEAVAVKVIEEEQR